MELGEIANPDAVKWGKPLDGIRVLAAEQMQALPYATQLLARLGAEVVKVEHPTHGESGRGAAPAMTDPQGRAVGSTYLRNNLGKRSVGLDLKSPEGQELFKALIPHFDVVAENFKPGTMARMGLGYDDLAEQFPEMIYVSISGFGNDEVSPYRSWPAYASVVEAMSGIYEYKSGPDRPPTTIPVGALGRHQLGAVRGHRHPGRAAPPRPHRGGPVRRHRHVRLDGGHDRHRDQLLVDGHPSRQPGARAVRGVPGVRRLRGGPGACASPSSPSWPSWSGHPEWIDDPRFADRSGWMPHLDDVIRPAVEVWAAGRTKVEAAAELTAAGLVAGPSFSAPDVIADPHVAGRHMLVEMPRTDGVAEPILIPGNPVKLSKMAEGPETRVPWVGEHTDEVLVAELGLDDAALAELRAHGVIT